MARINSKKLLVGIIGPIYGKEHRGKQIFQTRPNRSKQDKSKNHNAKLMRSVSHNSSFIRQVIEIHLNKRHESYMHSRFLGQLMSIMHQEDKIDFKQRSIFSVNCKALEGFEFNRKVLFKETFLERIIVQHTDKEVLQVRVPSFIPKEQVVFPKGCTDALLRIRAFAIHPDNNLSKEGPLRELNIEFSIHDPIVNETDWLCNCIDTDEKFELLVADIQFFYPINNTAQRLTLYNTKEYNPSMVIYAK